MHTIEMWLQHYDAWAIFCIIYLESTGAPLPGETVLISGSLFAVYDKISLFSLLLSSFLGAVLGNLTGYAIGYFAGKKLLVRFGYLIRLTHEKLEKYEAFLERRGFTFIFIARFIPIARQINGIVAGAGRMPFYKFFIANAIGAFVWIAVWGAGPYIAHVFFKTAIS